MSWFQPDWRQVELSWSWIQEEVKLLIDGLLPKSNLSSRSSVYLSPSGSISSAQPLGPCPVGVVSGAHTGTGFLRGGRLFSCWPICGAAIPIPSLRPGFGIGTTTVYPSYSGSIRDALVDVGVRCWDEKAYQGAGGTVRVFYLGRWGKLSAGQRAVNGSLRKKSGYSANSPWPP